MQKIIVDIYNTLWGRLKNLNPYSDSKPFIASHRDEEAIDPTLKWLNKRGLVFEVLNYLDRRKQK